jgi:hypothetical protein
LPQGYTPDGKAADLPPLPPEEPAPPASAEPQPSPQGRPQAAAPAAPASDRLAQLVDHARHAERIGKYTEAEACAREALEIDPDDLFAAAFARKMRALTLIKDDRPVVRTAIMTTPDASPSCCDCYAEGKACGPRKYEYDKLDVEVDKPAHSAAKADTTQGQGSPKPVDRIPNRSLEAIALEVTTGDAAKSAETSDCCDSAKESRAVAAGGALARGVLTTLCNPATAIAAAPVVPGLPEHPLPKLAKGCEAACEDDRQACPLTLKEAIRIGLENSEVVRVVALAGDQGKAADRSPIVIARLNADTAPWTFKAAVQEHVRAIEQQYWALSGQYVRRWACGVAVQVAEEAVKREQARLEAGHATTDALAAAKERLERARLDHVSSSADVITTERQLRNLLGLKPTDGRRIVPITAQAESHAPLNWEACLGEMARNQPDLVQHEETLRQCEMDVWMSHPFITQVSRRVRSGSLNASGPDRPMSLEKAEVARDREKAMLQQVKHQTTHALARFFLEVDSNGKQYATARRMSVAARENLQAKWARYEEGEVCVVDLLDAVDRWARDTAMVAQYRTSYNISLAAVEEAKGTLLEHEGITVVGDPQPRKKYVQATGRLVKIPVVPTNESPARYRVIEIPVGPAPKTDDKAVPTSAEGPAQPEAKAEDRPQGYSIRLPLGDLGAVQVRVRVWKSSAAPNVLLESAR